MTMKKWFHAPRSLPVVVLALSLTEGFVCVPAAAQSFIGSDVYPAPYTDLRGLVDRTQSDLRDAADLEKQKSKQRDRYRDAQGHLSTFDRHLVKGHFDKGELDKAIGNIKGVLDHNVLQASSRDTLLRDMTDLKIARDRTY
jgi:hypothetical protein